MAAATVAAQRPCRPADSAPFEVGHTVEKALMTPGRESLGAPYPQTFTAASRRWKSRIAPVYGRSVSRADEFHARP